eukprot:Clim_evm37s109 gene=Clim_evmTU37s109
MVVNVTDTQKIGIGLTGFGVTFLVLGMLLLFDRGLLAMGNVFFLSGIAFLIGLEKTFRFFFQRRKWRGTAFFIGGMIIVLYGWPVTGMLVEGFGFLNLFGDFFPTIISFLRRTPIIGPLLNLPVVAQIIDMISEPKLPV